MCSVGLRDRMVQKQKTLDLDLPVSSSAGKVHKREGGEIARQSLYRCAHQHTHKHTNPCKHMCTHMQTHTEKRHLVNSLEPTHWCVEGLESKGKGGGQTGTFHLSSFPPQPTADPIPSVSHSVKFCGREHTGLDLIWGCHNDPCGHLEG
jgi:hypothetical protein